MISRYGLINASAIVLVGLAALHAQQSPTQQTPGSAPVTVVNSSTAPVPVTAPNPLPVSGSLTVSGTVKTEDTFAPGRTIKRYGPVAAGIVSGLPPFIGPQVVPPVAAGKTFIVTGLHARVFSNISTAPLVRATCDVQLRDTSGLLVTFTAIPLVNQGDFSGNLQLSLPLNAGESINILCVAEAAGGVLVSQSSWVTATGYFVPAVQ